MPVQTVDGIEVHIDGRGPTVLMLHGWPDTHRLWDPQVAALRDSHRCARFTLPGFAPGHRKQAFSLDEVVGVIARVIDALSPDAPVTLLLHDWGCFFGCQAAMRRPQRVARVIGVDVGDAGSTRHLKEMGAAAKAATLGYQLWLAAAWRIGGAVGDRMAREMARRAHAPADPREVHAQMGYPYAVQWTGAAGGYRKLRRFAPHCPLLFIYGERKPFMFHSRAWADEVAARPGSRVVGFDCGHWLMVQRRERFNAAVLDWLKETQRAAEG